MSSILCGQRESLGKGGRGLCALSEARLVMVMAKGLSTSPRSPKAGAGPRVSQCNSVCDGGIAEGERRCWLGSGFF